ncbi:MAG TPA: AAA family ATPase [Nocardioides sp.]|nr:AAA family ATPase [Nocardioides sp.]
MASRSAVMVGRSVELSLLLEAFERSTQGSAQVAVVTGEAGIGKTRLVRELVDRLPGNTVLAWGHAVPLAGDELPYGVAGDLLRSLVREVDVEVVREALGAGARALGPLVPRLVEDADAALDRLALFTASQELLVDVSARTPVVLVVEDAHWADTSSLDLIRFWARTVTRGSIFVVVTSREAQTDGLAEVLSDLRRLPHATSVELRTLSEEALDSHIRLLDPEVGHTRLAEIRRLSEGIPLYVEELVAAGQGPGAAVSSVRADLSARLRTLPEDVAALLRLAALHRGPFSTSSLASVSGSDSDQVATAIDIGVSAQLLEEVGGVWQFHHELLRLAALESMAPSARDRGHQAWADVLAGSRRAVDLISAADHLETLGASMEALEARMAAAQAVWNLGTSMEAANQWRKALVLARQLPRDESAREHDDILGAWALAGGTWIDVRELVLRDEAPVEPGSLRGLYYRLARYPASIWSLGDHCEAPTLEEYREALSRLHEEQPSLLAYVTGVVVLQGMWLQERFDAFPETIQVVAELAETLPDRYTNARVALAEFRLIGMVGEEQDAARRKLVEENVRDSVDRDVHSRVWAHTTAAYELTRQGDLTGALVHVHQCYQLIPSPEADRLWSIASEHGSGIALMTGDWDEVLRLAADPLAGPDRYHQWARKWRAGLVQAWRDQEVSLSTAEELRGDMDAVESPPHDFPDVVEAAFLAAREPARARALVAWHLSRPDRTLIFDPSNGPPFGDAWALAAELAWRDPTSDEDYRSRVRRGAQDAAQATTLGGLWVREVEAHLARASGEDSSDAWQRAVAGWDDLPAPYRSAGCRLRWAEVLLGEDERERAEVLLDSALTSAEALRARPLGDEIRSLAGRARLRLPGHTPERTGMGPLTAREQEVLELLVQGKTNDQIGSALFMSPRTASVHVSHILAKLGASNRTEVAAIAHRLGLIG